MRSIRGARHPPDRSLGHLLDPVDLRSGQGGLGHPCPARGRCRHPIPRRTERRAAAGNREGDRAITARRKSWRRDFAHGSAARRHVPKLTEPRPTSRCQVIRLAISPRRPDPACAQPPRQTGTHGRGRSLLSSPCGRLEPAPFTRQPGKRDDDIRGPELATARRRICDPV